MSTNIPGGNGTKDPTFERIIQVLYDAQNPGETGPCLMGISPAGFDYKRRRILADGVSEEEFAQLREYSRRFEGHSYQVIRELKDGQPTYSAKDWSSVMNSPEYQNTIRKHLARELPKEESNGTKP